MAKAKDLEASAAKKQADAQAVGPKLQIEAQNAQTDQVYAQIDAHKAQMEAPKIAAETGLAHTKSIRELGLAAKDTHDLHKEADRIAQQGGVADMEQLADPAADETAGAPA